MPTKKWIQAIGMKKGALHEQLGIPANENIPVGKLAAAAKAPGKLGQRARFAQTLKGLGKGGGRAEETAEDKAMDKRASVKEGSVLDKRLDKAMATATKAKGKGGGGFGVTTSNYAAAGQGAKDPLRSLHAHQGKGAAVGPYGRGGGKGGGTVISPTAGAPSGALPKAGARPNVMKKVPPPPGVGGGSSKASKNGGAGLSMASGMRSIPMGSAGRGGLQRMPTPTISRAGLGRIGARSI